MASATLMGSERSKKWCSVISFFLAFGLIMQAEKLFTGCAVKGQRILQPVEALSSPRHINVIKGMSVWLHWNYTYIGSGLYNGSFVAFGSHAILFNITSQTGTFLLASRDGDNGTLKLGSQVPPQFTGRAEVIASNNTLAIHRLQYNDSNCQFLSIVILITNITAGPIPIQFYILRPTVSITVNGIPDFIQQPPSTLDVNENAVLQLTIHMDGNPKPSADFRWPHLNGSSPTNVPSVHVSPFLYSSTYTLDNIDASYCGRILQTTIRNNMGSLPVMRSTNVTVLLNLNSSFDLRVEKLSASRCVEVRWNLTQAGACYVKYNVILKDASGARLFTSSGYQLHLLRMCSKRIFNSVSDVQLNVSFKNKFTIVTTKVSGANRNGSTSTPRLSNWMIHGVYMVLLCWYLIVYLC